MNIIWVTLTSIVMVFVRQEKLPRGEEKNAKKEERREKKTTALKRLTSTLLLFKI